MDEPQNYHLISMSEHNGETIMTFHRLMDTKDPKDYHITVSLFAISSYLHVPRRDRAGKNEVVNTSIIRQIFEDINGGFTQNYVSV